MTAANRRAMIAGLASLGALALAHPALAASPAGQDIDVAALDELDGVFGSEDGFCPTGLDLNADGLTATTLWSAVETDRGMAGYGLAAARLEEAIAAGGKDGYRLRSLCAQAADGPMMALFERGGAPAPERYHLRQSGADYQAMVTGAAKAGLEPVYVSVDTHEGAPRFTTILRRAAGAWEARHDVKPGDMTALTQAMKARGLRLARSVPYLQGEELRFLSLYRAAGPHGWQAWMLEEADLKARHEQYRGQGHVMLQAIRYPVGDRMMWSCVWQSPAGAPADYFWGV